jgi:DMSO/TMAO reductase YedYZ molybdopterin-dependent catalytic subunit
MSRPNRWPRFSSPLRSTAVTARLGSALGICFGVCFLTGMLSHYQYAPWPWLLEPASPVWAYRVTQGLHVATGVASIPLLLAKLWSVYPNLFRWPAIRSAGHAIERLSVFVLVATALVQVTTGFLNTLNWYPWPWSFPSTHRYLGYLLIGSVLVHIGIKLPDIKYGLQAKLPDADVLTEIPWSENPMAHSNAGTVPPPEMPGLDRRGLFVAIGSGIGVVVLTTVGQTVTPLARLGLLATRDHREGPQGVPVNKTASTARVVDLAQDPDWRLEVAGASPFTLRLAEVESMSSVTRSFPITCVEGWSVGASWRGIPLLELVKRAGGDSSSRVEVQSLQPRGPYRRTTLEGPQVSEALLATHLNGERLNLDHGYPLRLISPNRPGVLNTKWLRGLEVS